MKRRSQFAIATKHTILRYPSLKLMWIPSAMWCTGEITPSFSSYRLFVSLDRGTGLYSPPSFFSSCLGLLKLGPPACEEPEERENVAISQAESRFAHPKCFIPPPTVSVPGPNFTSRRQYPGPAADADTDKLFVICLLGPFLS